MSLLASSRFRGLLIKLSFAVSLVIPSPLLAEVTVSANGTTENAYGLFYPFGWHLFNQSVLSMPDDCDDSHPSRHISQLYDTKLDDYVFQFHAHVNGPIDKDCATRKTDRQRTEIVLDYDSPASVKGAYGETQQIRWKFRIMGAFQPTKRFTHIFQYKAVGGPDSGPPMLTIGLKKGNPDILKIIHNPGNNQGYQTVKTVPLSDFRGEWIEAEVNVKSTSGGTAEITLRRIPDGEVLLSWSDNNIDLWRYNADFNRFHMGIYRSLEDFGNLRNEHPRFNDICVAEGSDSCPSYFDPPDDGNDDDGDTGDPYDCPYYDPETGQWIQCP